MPGPRGGQHDGGEGEECAFVGDSVTDVLAGRLAGATVIGFANKPGKADDLTRAGADAVTNRLSRVSAAGSAWAARLPHAGPPFACHTDQDGSQGRCPVLAGCRLPGSRLSSSRPPCKWRPFGPSHEIGYADH